MNLRRFSLLALAAIVLLALSLTPILAQESTETPETTMVTCDTDLILSLYTAQRFFGFDSFNSQMSSDTMLDIDSINKGQFTSLFDSLSTSDAVEISDTRRTSMMDMMVMSDADFDAHVVSMSSGNMTITTLDDGFADESEECAALRQTLRRFYLSLALTDSPTSGADADSGDSDTDSSDDGEEAPAGTITVNLTGAAEVPGPGDEDASGTATVYLRTDTNEVCVDITVQSITFPATAAHIHQAAAGQSGPPVVTLNTPTDDGLSSTCATVDAALMQELVNNPQNFYVNVHNGEFPDGAARGQLNAATSGADSDASDSDTDSSTDGDEVAAGALTVNLSGAAEIPGPGDEDASGTATVYLRSNTNEVCVDITVQNISFPATAAHIHQAAAGQSGPPVVTLNTPTDDGLSSTCATVDAALMQELVNNPQNFYINVHNGEFPDGAARGQLQ